jgi:predicted Zn-dependent peptidase
MSTNARRSRSRAFRLAAALALPLAAAGAQRLLAAGPPAPPPGLPPYGEDRPLPVPEIARERLPNGLEVWIVPRPGLPKVTAVLAVRGGIAADPAGQAGIAEVLVEAMRQGTATRSARRIAEELQGVGGELSSQASDDSLRVQATALSHGTGLVLEIVADVARRASFPDGEVELARSNAIQGLEAEQANPEFPADTTFAAAVFGDHPYRYVAAEKRVLEGITPQLLRAEHARRVRPESSLLLVVGRVDPTEAKALARRHFGDWRAAATAAAAALAAPAARPARRILVPRPGSVQSEIRVGGLAVRETDPDYFPALVLNTVVGGSFSSRMTQNIREDKGYSYGGGSALRTYAQAGVLEASAAVRNEVTGAALLEIFYELDRAALTQPTAEELERAKRYQRGLYLLRNQVQTTVATTLASLWVKGLPPEFLGEFVAKVDAVTAAEARAAGEQHFASRRQTVVVSGDADAIRRDLVPFGEFEVAEP